MNDLDDPRLYGKLDPQAMGAHLKGLPQQCRESWRQGTTLDLPPHFRGVETVAVVGMGGSAIGGDLLACLGARWPAAEIVLTLGARGARYWSAGVERTVPPVPVEAVDSTGAGDTFVGYLLAGRAEGREVGAALEQAARAAALCVGRPGALGSIPARHEVLARG